MLADDGFEDGIALASFTCRTKLAWLINQATCVLQDEECLSQNEDWI
jgi:hypothetical protein